MKYKTISVIIECIFLYVCTHDNNAYTCPE